MRGVVEPVAGVSGIELGATSGGGVTVTGTYVLSLETYVRSRV